MRKYASTSSDVGGEVVRYRVREYEVYQYRVEVGGLVISNIHYTSSLRLSKATGVNPCGRKGRPDEGPTTTWLLLDAWEIVLVQVRVEFLGGKSNGTQCICVMRLQSDVVL